MTLKHTTLLAILKFNILIAILFLSIGFRGISQTNPNMKPMLHSFLQQELPKKSGETRYVDFIVKVKDPSAKDFLEQNGAKIKYERGDLISVRIPLDKISEVSTSKLIYPIEFTIEKGVELNDTMRVRNRVNEVHQGLAPLTQMYDGENVIVGFIDSGIDYTHPDFQNPDGSTRVLAIWDQTKGFDAAFTPSKYGYGQEWDSAQINAGISTHDLIGTHHGSTVAGAASGNGLASGTNKGVAPKSDLIVVETDFNKPNWFATVADAVDYIFSLADFYGKPCVINASVGGYLGSHDGLDAPALMIDNLISEKPGRLFVCAGGNSGTQVPYHVRNEITADTTFTWFTINPSSAWGYPAAYLSIWVDKEAFDDVHFAIGADKISPDFEFRGRTDFKNLLADNMVDNVTNDALIVGANTLANIEYYVTEDNDRYEIIVFIPNPDSSQYYYRFITTTQTSGSYDMWAGSWMRISDVVSSGLPSVADFPDMQYYVMPDSLQSIVTSWACSPNTITVANYVNTDRYTDYNGNVQIPSGANPNFPKHLKQHSSKGPNRKGVIKPDIAATGDFIFAPSVVSDVIARRTSNPTTLHQSGWHLRNGGTSMASPVVAGVGALLLQRCPNLTPQKFKEIITTTAFKDEFTGNSLPNNAWGYGKVDAYTALVSTLLPSPVITVFGESLMSSMAHAYQWYQNGEPISGATSQILSDVELGADYIVEVFNEFGCNAFSSPLNSLSILTANFGFSLYPNPTTGLIHIDFQQEQHGTSLKIVDVVGREVLHFENLSQQNTIDATTLDSGIYFVIIKNNTQQLSKVSFVKQ
jgi:subtilisin family serine protease